MNKLAIELDKANLERQKYFYLIRRKTREKDAFEGLQ
jgi:hypothetical protein